MFHIFTIALLSFYAIGLGELHFIILRLKLIRKRKMLHKDGSLFRLEKIFFFSCPWDAEEKENIDLDFCTKIFALRTRSLNFAVRTKVGTKVS